MASPTIKALRRHAIAATLREPTTLKQGIERLGFVQCDPIRAPARAQDLILRHRVADYHAGDVEQKYPQLGLDEDFVYAYGIVPETTWRLLHPRHHKPLTKIQQRVHELVCAQASMHPRELEAHLGRKRQVNAWGSYSKATTRCLEQLHYRGFLRIAGRDKGIRLYQAARAQTEYLPPPERLRRLILLIANILAPVPERSLRAALRHLGRAAPTLKGRVPALHALIGDGEIAAAELDGVRYLWPKGNHPAQAADPPAVVRFLAPFDPLVWDRYRFELLWGWAYRFEAYTPPAKRKMGYYALPLLWRDDIIGWVNIKKIGGQIEADPGFIHAAPSTRAFRTAYADEVDRMREFLRGAAE